MQLVPNSWGSPRSARLWEFNKNHEPGGTSKGGRFAKGSGVEQLGGQLPGMISGAAADLAKHRARMLEVSFGGGKRTKSIMRPTMEDIERDPALRAKADAWAEKMNGRPMSFEDVPDWMFKETDPSEPIETMVFMDMRNGKLVPTPLGDMMEGGSDFVMVPRDAPRGDTILPIHTHPSSGPFSSDDIRVALRRTDPAIMVFGKDGSWYHLDTSPVDNATGRNYGPLFDLAGSWSTHPGRASAMDETNGILRGLGVDLDMAAIDERSRERKIAQAVLDYVGRDHYAKARKVVAERLGLASRFTYYLAPRKSNAERAAEIAAEYGHHRR